MDDVILEIMDHCAKNAIPKTVNKEVKKKTNLDCSTPQTSKTNAPSTTIKLNSNIRLISDIRVI